jgi:hypothetical protein
MMADTNVLSKVETKAAAALPVMQVRVSGRVEKSRVYEGKRYTQILTPAPDAYSRPQLVEVRSKSKVGEAGDEVSLVCLLGGFSRKPYKVRNDDTGEISMITPVDHTLDFVE